MEGSDTYYRYDEVIYSAGCDEYGDPIRGFGRVDIVLHSYPVTKRTPCGVVINAYGRRKFIKTKALRHWALWSEKAALDSFIARKEKQISILARQTEVAKDALSIAMGRLPSDPFNDALAELSQGPLP